MTHREKVIISAYTGVLMCDFGDVHEYIEKYLTELYGRMSWLMKKYGMKLKKRLGLISLHCARLRRPKNEHNREKACTDISSRMC